MSISHGDIPVLDISLLQDNPADPDIASALVAAGHSVGFCYLTGHGIPTEQEAVAMSVSHDFFRLELGEKTALSIGNSPHFRGYTPLGNEITRGARDWREQIDIGLDEQTVSTANGQPPWQRLRGPNQWPPGLPAMAPAIGAWMTSMEALAVRCLRALAVGLGQSVDLFDDYMLPRGDPHLKIIRYAGQADSDTSGPNSEQATGQGVGWHQDSGLLTFILQDGTEGLEVRAADGRVVPAVPRPNTYLMNLGEMLQRATDGYLRATEHRVVSPPPGQERLSLAYFAHPSFETVVEPIRLPAALAAAAPGGENADPNDPVFSQFGDNYLKIRLRSHPDVADRFYADVRLG